MVPGVSRGHYCRGGSDTEGAVSALTVGFQGLPCRKYWDFVRGGKGRAGLQGIPLLGLGGWGRSPAVAVPVESKGGSGVSLSVLLGSSRSQALTAR